MIGRILLLLAIGLLPLVGQTASPLSSDLDRHISETLRQRKYSWVTETNEQRPAKRPSWGPIQAIRQLVERIQGTMNRALSSFVRWLERLFSRNGNPAVTREQSHMPHFSLWLLGLLGGLALLAAVFLMRRKGPAVVPAVPEADVVTRIQDEQTLATALPEQEWLRLASEYFGRREGRLAVRALHLAELALLAERGLLSISAYKTTADYRGDLRRRGRSTVMTDLFARNSLRYESTWYGSHEVSNDLVENFRRDLDRLREVARA